jgi:hypothetical protein
MKEQIYKLEVKLNDSQNLKKEKRTKLRSHGKQTLPNVDFIVRQLVGDKFGNRKVF